MSRSSFSLFWCRSGSPVGCGSDPAGGGVVTRRLLDRFARDVASAAGSGSTPESAAALDIASADDFTFVPASASLLRSAITARGAWRG
ncbi:hypothetical protein [Salinibacterium amurskyense]|uniref:hypothetical protein n=1 Tax=Salinibacterium amurskyense TaxID=205941 RepID=UPI000C241261|nr:hypothetical protein [Salinibacterium amurskyense]RLQ83734.1 hypothetical protein D9C83_04665 [Salinibacterium amurskyense]